MKQRDNEKTGAPEDARQGAVLPPRRSPSEPRGASQAATDLLSRARPEADGLSTPELSHPANAAPLADLLGHLQQSHGNIYVQRVVSELDEDKFGKAPRPRGSVADTTAAGGREQESGQRLEAGVRSEMESAFGEDFGAVRVHTGVEAETLNEDLGARAVTRGRDIYFARGEYNPATGDGREVLAHELTHVLQQRENSLGDQSHSVGKVGDSFEQEARETAALVLSGRRAQVSQRAHAPALQKDEKPKAEEKPSVKTHPTEITWTPATGSIDADGHFSVAYNYNIVKDADYVPLSLTVSEGVAVTVVPISTVPSDAYTIKNEGGTSARSVMITASYHLVHPPVFQVTMTKGVFTYITVFRFPSSG